MPRNRWHLKIGLTSEITRRRRGCRVTMPCAQVMNLTISWPSRWFGRDEDGGQAERELSPQDQQDRDIAEAGGVADARVEQAPVRQQRDADAAGDARRGRRHASPEAA